MSRKQQRPTQICTGNRPEDGVASEALRKHIIHIPPPWPAPLQELEFALEDLRNNILYGTIAVEMGTLAPKTAGSMYIDAIDSMLRRLNAARSEKEQSQ
jgi:hypothetical protein